MLTKTKRTLIVFCGDEGTEGGNNSPSAAAFRSVLVSDVLLGTSIVSLRGGGSPIGGGGFFLTFAASLRATLGRGSLTSLFFFSFVIFRPGGKFDEFSLVVMIPGGTDLLAAAAGGGIPGGDENICLLLFSLSVCVCGDGDAFAVIAIPGGETGLRFS